MKQFIVVYSSDSRGSVEARHLTYKTVNAPDDADITSVAETMRKTSDGPYTSFYKLIDPDLLEQLTLEPTRGYKIVKNDDPSK